MLLIHDVVEENDRAADVGDVQIGWFPDSPYNAELAKRYMFTATAEGGKKSSIDILKAIRDTYLFPNENRLTVIATYGHGKTHLALALANFFGKPFDSPEVADLLENIRHTAENLHVGFRSFKEDNPPFLVVRLNGIAPESLHRLFLNALALALKEAEPYIGQVSLPFWFAEAEAFLEKLTEEQRSRADAFLEVYRHDVASLLAAVRDHDSTVYELCRDLSYHLNNVRGDFGGDVSLDAAIQWVTKEYCGREKPLRGLLVLFDEFAVFVEKYAERRVGSNTGALQQLLDGIANARDAACFIAFAQTDPDDVAKRFFARNTAHSTQEQDLTKELTRLPTDQRSLLHSSLERVLDTYLKQVPEHLAEVADKTGDAFQDATDLAVQLLPQRYDYKQGWGPEEVYTILTEGCFPLHPLTTGLLCTLQLQQGTVTRSVLGAVRAALNARRDQPAVLENGLPNWIYPVALVDWFGDMISDESLYAQFARSMQNVGGDVSAVEKDTLKAILLQITANLVPLTHAPGGYARLVGFLAGHPEGDCQAALQALADRYLIDKDPVKELYRFPQGGQGEQARKLLKEVERLGANTKITVTLINDDLQRTNRLKKQPAEQLPAGNPSDYAAQEWLLTKESFTAQMLRERVARRFQMGPRSLENGERGAIVYLLARNDEEVTHFQTEAQRILDLAFPATEGMPVPVVVGVPTAPRPRLLSRLRNERALTEMQSELREYGAAAVQKVRDTLKAEIDADLSSLRSDVQWIVPTLFLGEVNRSAARNDGKMKLDCCYGLAYADMPPAFKKQYQATSANLRTGVKLVAEPLARGRLREEQNTIKKANAIARDIITDYLIGSGQSSWGLADALGTPQIPPRLRIHKAWAHLDRHFAPGAEPALVRDALIPLLNPPFGYDWNHATLLFCAWVGYHLNRIKFLEAGINKSIHEYFPLLVRPDNFIHELCARTDLRLIQLDEESEAKRVRALVENMRGKRLTPTEARNYRIEFNGFAQNTAMDPETREIAGQASEQLAGALKKVEEYEDAVDRILRVLTTSAGIPDILGHLERIENNDLPRLTLVSTETAPDAATVRERVRSHLSSLIQREAAKYNVLRHLENYREFRDGLERARDYAGRINDVSLRSAVEAKITALEERKKELEAEQQDRFLMAELQSLHPATLPIVRLVESEEQLQGRAALGERAGELLEKRRADIQKALADAREFLARLPETVDSLVSHRQVLDQQRRLDQRQFRFEGAEEEVCFRALDARLSCLDAAFGLLEKTPLRSLSTPREMDDRESELCEALSNYVEALSDVQKQIFSKTLEGLAERRVGETEKALQWLERYESKPPRDVSTLDEPPAFLSAEGKKRLKVLRARLQEEIQRRIDKDETEAILTRFRRLSPTKQQECLKLLQGQLAVPQKEAA